MAATEVQPASSNEEAASLPVPQEQALASTSSLVQSITTEQLAEYSRRLRNPDDAAAFLAEVLHLPEYRFDARSAIKLDYASYALEFAKDNGFGPVRTAAVFNLCQRVLEACIGGTEYAECEALLKAELLRMCHMRPGADDARLSPDEVARVGQFMARTFFRHFRLYGYVFSNEQDHTQYSAQPLVETALIQPFELALTEKQWEQHHEDKRLQAEAEQRAAEEAEAARLEAERQEQEARKAAEAAERRRHELARKPATLEEAIQQLVALRLEAEKSLLTEEYKAKETALAAQVAEMEAKAAAAAAAAAAASAAAAAAPAAPSPSPGKK